MTKTALLIANPTAKRGEPAVRNVITKLSKGYADQGWQTIAQFTERNGPRERQIVAQHADQVDTVVAIGGDGTVRETVLGLSDAQRSRLVIGFVPMGNANVLAREVGIACDDHDQAIAQVFAGTPRAMDVGAIDGQPTFLLMLDIGYFAQVVHSVSGLRGRAATNWMYSLGGDLLYGGVGLIKLLTPKRPEFVVQADDQEPFTTSSLAIANAATYAKTGSFCPDADPSDGLLNFNGVRRGKTLRYSLAAMSGKPDDAVSFTGSAKRITVRATDEKFVCQVDGDPLPAGPFAELNVQVLPSYYSLIAPPAALPATVKNPSDAP